MKKGIPSLLAVQRRWPSTRGVNFGKDKVCLLNAAALFLTAEPSAADLTPRGSFSSFLKRELACSLNRCMGILVGIDVIPALSVTPGRISKGPSWKCSRKCWKTMGWQEEVDSREASRSFNRLYLLPVLSFLIPAQSIPLAQHHFVWGTGRPAR